MSKRHAYLIMAHNQFRLLGRQLEVLDHECNDFYIHIDKKSKVNLAEIKSHIQKGNIYFTDRITVNWGGYSIVRAELLLLEAATQVDHYAYYHFISGADFPLRKQDEILEYYDNAEGKLFISLSDSFKQEYINRIKYFYPFQDCAISKAGNFVGRVLRNSGRIVQNMLHVNRMNTELQYGVGSQFFDITDEFARYIISKKKEINKMFKYTLIPDEIFLQTMYLNWPGRDDTKLNRSTIMDHPFIQSIYLDINRAIDWVRGTPYVYTKNDYNLLLESGCLFARKFDYERHPEIIEEICNTIT